MKCRTCGANNFQDATYCSSCGASLNYPKESIQVNTKKSPNMSLTQRSILAIVAYSFLFTSGAFYIGRFLITTFSLDPTNEMVYLFLNASTNFILYLSLFGVSLLLLHYELRLDFAKLRGVTQKTIINRSLETLGYLYIAAILGNLILMVLGKDGTSGNQIAIERMLYSPYAVVIIITVVLFGPFVEEVIFRLAGFAIFPKKIPVIAVIFITSLLFGYIHVSQSQDYIMIIPYFVQGLAIGHMYAKYKNFYVVFIGHALYNLISVILTYIMI